MTKQKTPKMLQAEAGRGPMEQWLPTMVEEKGQTAAALALGVSRRTLREWLLILGLRVQRSVAPRGKL